MLKQLLFFFILTLPCLLVGQQTAAGMFADIKEDYAKIQALKAELSADTKEGKDKTYLQELGRRIEDEKQRLQAKRERYWALRSKNPWKALNMLVIKKLERAGPGAVDPVNEAIVGPEVPMKLKGYLIEHDDYEYLLPGELPVMTKLTDRCGMMLVGNFGVFESRVVLIKDSLLYGGRIWLRGGEADDRNDFKTVEFITSKSEELVAKVLHSEANTGDKDVCRAISTIDREKARMRTAEFRGSSEEELAVLQARIDSMEEQLKWTTAQAAFEARVIAIDSFTEMWKGQEAIIDGYLKLREGGGVFDPEYHYFDFYNWALREQ
jgi:hypothetical protein